MAEVDSSTGGILAPAGSPAPEEDAELVAIFQQLFAQIVGITGMLVRPRWQAIPPKQPEASVTWCALGVTVSGIDGGPMLEHISAGEGATRYVTHEQIDVATTFYGPLARAAAARLRDGLAIRQNIEPLTAKAMAFIDTGVIRIVPEIVNQTWIHRYDMLARFRRKVTRVYPVRNVLAADIHLFDDSTHVEETIHVPPHP